MDETHKPAGILPRHHPGGFFLARVLVEAMPVASPGICRSAPYGRVAPCVGARPKGRAIARLHFAACGHIPGEATGITPSNASGCSKAAEAHLASEGPSPLKSGSPMLLVLRVERVEGRAGRGLGECGRKAATCNLSSARPLGRALTRGATRP